MYGEDYYQNERCDHFDQPLVLLNEGSSTSMLAVTWKKEGFPFLRSLFLGTGAAAFLLAFSFIFLPWLAIRVSFGMEVFVFLITLPIVAVLFHLVMLIKPLLDWFSGPQSVFLCTSVLLLFAAAVKIFKLRLISNGHVTASVSKREITVSRNWFNLFYSQTKIKWYELAMVSLRKRNSGGNDHEVISFLTKDGQSEVIDAVCLNDERMRANLIGYIRRYAPHALSSELEVRSLANESSSYADIWMDTLHQKQRRKRIDELEQGASLSNERFTVVKKLGSGGQGTAYLATVQYLCDRVFNESEHSDVEMVVLKEFILPGFENPALLTEIVARIQHEALLLKSLNHSKIVRVIDAFIEDLRGYLVIEHAVGTSLRERVVQNGPLRESEAVELAMQMCSILEYLHGHAPQVVHRDFTPDNLIIDGKGNLKLIDFNLAKVPNLTDTAICAGKPPYMAPEQLRGCPVPASDFYSMGALLHFLLTGEDPEPLSVCSPRQRNLSVSPSFNHLIECLTDQETELRMNTASQVRKLLTLQTSAHAV